MEDGTIADSQLSASSIAGSSYVVTLARLDDTVRSWAAGSNNPPNQWVQVDLLEAMQVTGVITQGRYESGQWVKKYNVLYGDDGSNFAYVQDSGGSNMVRTSKYILQSSHRQWKILDLLFLSELV